jgi:hypothetical protein
MFHPRLGRLIHRALLHLLGLCQLAPSNNELNVVHERRATAPVDSQSSPGLSLGLILGLRGCGCGALP